MKMVTRIHTFIVAVAWAAWGGCVEEPGVGEGYEKPLFNHDLVEGESCAGCHIEVRPAPKEEHPHGGGQECSVCHTPKNDNSGWLPRNPFSHVPSPKSCMDCHVQDRPKREDHPASGDCVSCHTYPSFSP